MISWSLGNLLKQLKIVNPKKNWIKSLLTFFIIKMQKLHDYEIVIETNWELDYITITSEIEEITEELFNAILKAVKSDSLILSIARIN